jgi:ABC-type transport system involved in multi-copper enzyme maturation permease subunit
LPTLSLLRKISNRVSWVYRERPRFFNNPIILRELIVQLRKKQSFFYLLVFLGVGSFLFIAWWRNFISRSYIYYDYDSVSRELLISLTLVEGVILLIISPLLSATAVNLERERETWDLLRTTPISLFSIILGKYLSSLFFVWIVSISILPIFSLSMPAGGVSPSEIMAIFCIFTEGVAIASLIGLYCSIRWKHTIQSISFTYAFCFLYFFILPISTLFFSNHMGIPFLSSPVMVGFALLYPPFLFVQEFGITAQQGLWIHYTFFTLIFLTLIALCMWQMAPARIERSKEYFRRKAIAVGSRLNNAFLLAFLSIGVWILIAFIQLMFYFIEFTIWWGIITNEFASAFLMTIGVLGVLIFPIVSIAKYQTMWDRRTWQEAASTPIQLRRYLFRSVKEPLFIFCKWIALVSPFFLIAFFLQPKAFAASIWAIFFLGETFFLITAIALACSLTTRSFFLSLVYTYGFLVGIFFFIPAIIMKFDRFLGLSASPLTIAFLPFLQYNRYYSSSKIIEFYPHFLLMILYIEIALIFSERRVLAIVGRFQRESLFGWIRRTLKNQTPTMESDPLAREIQFFPDGKNPIYGRERRDFSLYRRSSFTKNLVGLFLASSTLFLILPVLSLTYYENFILFNELLSPFMLMMFLIPFFVLPYASNSFRKERDQYTWDLISTTTLTPLQMIVGKMRAVLWMFHRRFFVFLTPLFILVLFLMVSDKIIKSNMLYLLLYGIVIIYAYAFFFSSVALFFSVRASKTTTAYIVPLIAAFLFFALPIFLEIAGYRSDELLAIISPLALLDQVRRQSTFWYTAFQTQMSLYAFASLLFYFLTYSSLRNSSEKN